MENNHIEYIQGEKFKTLSNGVNVFYCNTPDVNNFFKTIDIKNEFILISHNSDGKVDINCNRYDADVSLMPDNLIKWYAQNVNFYHPKIESIPIGLENSMWFPELNKIPKITSKNLETKTIKNYVYLNVNPNTNLRDRTEVYNLFKNKDFVTSEYGSNGIGYDNYINNIYNHKFVLCPEGNGIDTHRLWETLYLKSIPIVKRNINTKYYEDMPILFVDNWCDITKELLDEQLSKWNKNNYEKLDFRYWKNIIEKEAKLLK